MLHWTFLGSPILLRLAVISVIQLVDSALAVLNDFPQMLGIHIEMLAFKPFPTLGRAVVLTSLPIWRVRLH